VFLATGAFWDNYAPDARAPGDIAQKDFRGWAGITLVALFGKYE